MTVETDVPAGLMLVDPTEIDQRFRVVLWAAPGEGKSVGAASAPAPILVLSADRPGAYRYARRHYKGKDIREARFEGPQSLSDVLKYLRANPDVRTVIVDPFHNIYDRLVDAAPKRGDGDPDYQRVNKALLDFLYRLREFDVNVVLVAHEKVNDGRKGDGKMYPQLGGPSLMNKVLAESDIVARVEREEPTDEQSARYVAQLTPRPGLVCKESTGVLGERRSLDLSEWFETASEAERPDDSDLPWSEEPTLEAAVESGDVASEPVA